ncbi:uncharacterized protein SPSK_03623 [Sporothrix schenckii 1099-18]|uniref:GPI anchored protein n=1 Tax=Sporothrix schenckii 1099-18 TaxID=1397361 RepID=A0A0F2LZ89_SPOSC|nr:uncharacterized protein SPSK_03623 [Sporothrix schenckii 1099-18]KJR82773.1 hypothetical protein SPSK_03623 [Sporothrix schenckii 1099-18]
MKSALASLLALAAFATATDSFNFPGGGDGEDCSDEPNSSTGFFVPSTTIHAHPTTTPVGELLPSVELTTSTIFSTTTSTIISCHPTVTSCPAESTVLTTVTVAVSTTRRACRLVAGKLLGRTHQRPGRLLLPGCPVCPAPAASTPAAEASSAPAASAPASKAWSSAAHPSGAAAGSGTSAPKTPTTSAPHVVVTAGAAHNGLGAAGAVAAAVAVAALF